MDMGLIYFTLFFIFSVGFVYSKPPDNTIQTITDGLNLIDEINNDAYEVADYYSMNQLVECINQIKLETGIRIGKSCEELLAGEKLTVNVSYDESPTGVQMKYTLEKNNENHYSIGVNPFFYYREKEEGSEYYSYYSTREHRKMMRTKVVGCFKKIGALEVGNGKKINFYLDQNAPIVAIAEDRHDPEYRSNSATYSFNIYCSEIIHEVLHLLGLCDDYAEVDRFPFRVTTESLNLMSTPRESIDAFKGSFVLSKCAELHPFDPSKKESKKCKKYSEEEAGRISYIDFEQTLGDYVPEFDYFVKRIMPGNQKSALREDQVNAILYPLCEEKNKKYYTCSRYAYLEPGELVEPAPAYCKELFNQNKEESEK